MLRGRTVPCWLSSSYSPGLGWRGYWWVADCWCWEVRTAGPVFDQIALATGAAETFLAQLQVGNTVATHPSSGAGFKAGKLIEGFAKFVGQYPVLAGNTGRAAGVFNVMRMNGVRQTTARLVPC